MGVYSDSVKAFTSRLVFTRRCWFSWLVVWTNLIRGFLLCAAFFPSEKNNGQFLSFSEKFPAQYHTSAVIINVGGVFVFAKLIVPCFLLWQAGSRIGELLKFCYKHFTLFDMCNTRSVYPCDSSDWKTFFQYGRISQRELPTFLRFWSAHGSSPAQSESYELTVLIFLRDETRKVRVPRERIRQSEELCI